jgi:peptidoglycan/xylan/chitin deacetylase (PgdA/CDA1 family)
MFSSGNLPLELPNKTLALTYDDGPGPHTLAIAEFLHDRRIAATFFVVGQHVRERRAIVREVAKLGHLIGNHTDTHTPFRDLESDPDRVIQEVMDADREIQQFVGNRAFFLRTPGGEWYSSFAEALNRNNELHKYSGPIAWHIDCADYEIGSPRYRKPGNPIYTFEQCQECYLQRVRERGHGIVLLHDWSADAGDLGEQLRSKNRTLELTKSLMPQLTDFKFIALDEIGRLS